MPVFNVEVKRELDLGPESVAAKKINFCYRCRLCSEIFSSRYAYAIHINNHEIACFKCKIKFETWTDVDEHVVYCPLRFESGGSTPCLQQIRAKNKTTL